MFSKSKSLSSPARWRHLSLITWLAATSAGLVSHTALADIVRISSVNGDYEAAHADQIDVRPGDVIQLSADVFTDNGDGTFAAQSKVAEDFVWNADDSATDLCDVSQGASCLSTTHFEANDYGVSFYVPYDFSGQTITIVVNASDTPGTQDQIVLNNLAFSDPNDTPPTDVVTDPSTYNPPALDPQTALSGQGRWEIIDGIRYFVPYAYVDNYVPYQNGYWSYTGDEDGDGDGWTWVSYDSWGWMTDHYGTWRHHGVFGWMWRPFEGADFIYHHHTISWFHDGGAHVGWYPYHEGWDRYYAFGPEHGFDDGFWVGFGSGRSYGTPGLFPGFTVIHGADFGWNNCLERRLGDAEALAAWRTGFGSHFYGAYPGFGRIADVRASRSWVETGFNVHVVDTHTDRRVIGGVELRYPVAVHPVPAIDVRPPFAQAGSMHQAFPVGAVFHAGAVAPGHPVFISPTADGRGLAHPPQVFNSANHTVSSLPPQTAHPVAANPSNPVYHPAPVAAHPVAPPPYHPGQPSHPGHTGQPSNPGHPVGPAPAPVHTNPSEPIPVHTNPSEPTPVHTNPSEPTPVHTNPSEPTPVHTNPSEPTPVHTNPSEPTPVHTNPSEPTPVHTNPAPAPAPRPQPAPAPRPQPAPAPRPQPAPAPRPQPAPAPRPQPAPAPRPQPAPAPRPQPAPAPRPQPAPAPHGPHHLDVDEA